MVQTRAFTDGFDLYPATTGQAGFGVFSTWLGNSSTFSLIEGRFGGQAARIAGNGVVQRYRTFPDSLYGCCGFAFRQLASGAMGIIMLSSLDGTAQLTLCYTSAGQLAWRRGGDPYNSPVFAVTSTQKIFPNVWHYIEVEWRIDDVIGTLKLYLDGVEVPELTYTGDTRSSGTGIGIGRFGILAQTGVSHDYDDIYVEIGSAAGENVRVGEGRMEVLPVSEDVSNTGFTPSAGTKLYPTLANVPADIASYSGADAQGSVMRLKHKPLASPPEKVYGVQLVNLSQKTEAGTRIIRNKIWSGAAEGNGANQAEQLNTSTFKEDWISKNPDGSVDWTGASVNASEIGVEITT